MIGLKYADAILKARRQGTLREVRHLKQIGIRAPERVAPYVLLDGQRPPHQPRLFA